MSIDSLSSRGQKAFNTTSRIDGKLSQQARQDIYHPSDNPNGAFVLNIAENKLNWPILKAKFEQICRQNSIPDWVATYTPDNGALSVRQAVAAFMQNSFGVDGIGAIDATKIAFSSGAAGIIEVSTFLCAEQNDVAVIPAPAYPVYTQDIGHFSGLQRYDLHVTPDSDDAASTTSILTTDLLEQTKKDLDDKGQRFRLLILTSPDNPTGIIYTKAQYIEIANWCMNNQIHLFVNEIYALSQIDTTHPDIASDYNVKHTFFSFSNIIRQYKNPYLHLWYAFSKDFGLSGFRFGVIYSENSALMQAYDNVNATHNVSNHTQWLIQELLQDEDFIRQYINANQHSLTASYVSVIHCLRELQIPYTPSYGSLFVWADFSAFLDSQSDESEIEFWLDLYNQTRILLTPGIGFGHTKRGLMRFVFSAVDYDTLQLVLKKLRAFIIAKRT